MNEIFQLQLLEIFQHSESQLQNKSIFIVVNIQIEEFFDPAHSVVYRISMAGELRSYPLYASAGFQIDGQRLYQFGIMLPVIAEDRFQTSRIFSENLLIFGRKQHFVKSHFIERNAFTVFKFRITDGSSGVAETQFDIGEIRHYSADATAQRTGMMNLAQIFYDFFRICISSSIRYVLK